jgi:hypothetical protein
MSQNLFQSTTVQLQHAFTLVPDDTKPLPNHARALYVGVAGNIAVIAGADPDGIPGASQIVILANVPVGLLRDVNIKQVMATGTSAGSIVGWY